MTIVRILWYRLRNIPFRFRWQTSKVKTYLGAEGRQHKPENAWVEGMAGVGSDKRCNSLSSLIGLRLDIKVPK